MKPEIVSFIGAGPGDPDLLTVKAKRIIESADLVVYAGSLVSPEIVALAPFHADVHDSAIMTLEQTHALVRAAALAGKKVARIHTGDPSIYGALAEQIQLLDADSIPWQIVPGVTAAMAAAAAAGISFSIPGLRQSLLITRLEGRTPMPANEALETFSGLGIAMAIYLAGHRCEEVALRLAAGLPPDTEVICCSRIGWPEEKIIRTTVGNLSKIAGEIGRQTVLLVLPGAASRNERSCLYNPDFTHSFRTNG